MKAGVMLMLSALSFEALCAEGGLIPFDNYYISVETNRWLEGAHGENHLHVAVTVANGPEYPEGSVTWDVDCFEFSAAQRMMPAAEIEAFLEVADAAREKRPYKKELITETFEGDKKTVYEWSETDGKTTIHVTRGEESATFALEEADRVRNAIAMAKSGEAWFRKLLTSDKPPQPSDEAKPPVADGYYLQSDLGEVSGEGLGYAVSIGAMSTNGLVQYSIEHELRHYTDGNMDATTGGQWVAGVFRKLATACDSFEKHQAFNFKSQADEDGQGYTITANPDTRKAELVLQPGKFFPKKEPWTGSFGEQQLKDIRTLVNGYEAREKWFKEHELLFFTRPEASKNDKATVKQADESDGR